MTGYKLSSHVIMWSQLENLCHNFINDLLTFYIHKGHQAYNLVTGTYLEAWRIKQLHRLTSEKETNYNRTKNQNVIDKHNQEAFSLVEI